MYSAPELYSIIDRFVNESPFAVEPENCFPEGVKTEASDSKVSSLFVDRHITIGIEALKLIRRNGKSVRHLRFDE